MNQLFPNVTAPDRIETVPVRATRRIFVRDLVIDAVIGVYPQEMTKSQRVRVCADLTVDDPGPLTSDAIADVVSYEVIVAAVRAVADSGHIHLVETFAERIAERCLADQRVHFARIVVEKLDILPGDASAGVEIERRRPGRSGDFAD